MDHKVRSTNMDHKVKITNNTKLQIYTTKSKIKKNGTTKWKVQIMQNYKYIPPSQKLKKTGPPNEKYK